MYGDGTGGEGAAAVAAPQDGRWTPHRRSGPDPLLEKPGPPTSRDARRGPDSTTGRMAGPKTRICFALAGVLQACHERLLDQAGPAPREGREVFQRSANPCENRLKKKVPFDPRQDAWHGPTQCVWGTCHNWAALVVSSCSKRPMRKRVWSGRGRPLAVRLCQALPPAVKAVNFWYTERALDRPAGSCGAPGGCSAAVAPQVGRACHSISMSPASGRTCPGSHRRICFSTNRRSGTEALLAADESRPVERLTCGRTPSARR